MSEHIRRIERHERRWRERSFRHFDMTKRGRMSWADWFYMQVYS